MIDSLLTDASRSAIPVVPVHSAELTKVLATRSAAERTWVKANGFEAKPGSFCLLSDSSGNLATVLLGVTESPDLWAASVLVQVLPVGVYTLDTHWDVTAIEQVTLGWALAAYQFTRYRKAERAPAQLRVDKRCDIHKIRTLINGIGLTRDLVNTPAQDMMPQHLSATMSTLAEQCGAQFSEIVGDDLLAKNYPVIHAVGRASVHAPRLLDLRWGNPAHPKLTLVGKGVCFDSGGLDLKGASGMRLMKKDMGGAAHVIGLASMIMNNHLPVRLRVLVAAVENAVSGDAFRPGDVLTSRNGKTIEIDNTDAEGRLVLCDAIAEAVTEKPELLIDMATLTGAARVALGPDVPALFAQHAGTAAALQELSASMADPMWQLPLFAPYKRWLKSDIADLVNSAGTPYGGAITAALFLQAFVPEKMDWVHIDVMAWNTEGQPGRPKGGEAMGLRAFLAYLQQRYSTVGEAPGHVVSG